MLDIYPTLKTWLEAGETIAFATVVNTWGSSPRQPGAVLALTADGKMVGSVSGGCVETAVVQEGQAVLATNTAKLLHYGVADEMAWDVGLACGGNVDIFVQPIAQLDVANIVAAVEAEQTLAIATVIKAETEVGQSIVITGRGLSPNIVPTTPLPQFAQQGLAEGKSFLTTLADDTQVFVNVIVPPPKLIAVGGVHVTQALFAYAKTLGFRTVLIEPRELFGNPERFSNADEIVNIWPDEALRQLNVTPSTAIAVLSHDPKLDDPALVEALPSAAFYVGALGSRTTQAARRDRMLAEGVAKEDLDRLHGPIGLKLGGRRPEEIALAIIAQIVQEQYK